MSVLSGTANGNNFLFLENYHINYFDLYNDSLRFCEIDSLEVKTNDINNILAFSTNFVLIRNITEFMNNIINKTKNSPKMVLLSAHDTTIADMEDMVNNLFSINRYYPSYSSSMIFELNKDDDKDEYLVNFIFNDIIVKKVDFSIFRQTIMNKTWR